MKKAFLAPFSLIGFVLILSFGGCNPGGSGGQGKGEEGGGGGVEDTCFDCNQSEAAFLHLDSENIAALLNVDPSTIESSALSTLKQATEGDSTVETMPSPLQGLDAATGLIRNVLRVFSEETDESFEEDSDAGLSADDWDRIPRIVSIAECGGYVYLVFERPFIVRTETPDGQTLADYSDPWSPSSPFTSQLLRSSAPITDYKAGDRVERTNLEGVLYSFEINTWDKRRNIQFDGSCNLYVTAHVPGTSDDVLLKIAPGAAENDYEEVINANICYERYLVTSGGDVHYTGRTSTGSDCGGGSSFYRMVSSTGTLSEITRDWWDYKFEPKDDGKVVFYGPDPTQDGVPSWDSSCLFEFDGSKSGDARYTKLVNCINDWWRYMNQGPSSEFLTTANDTERERCAEQFYTYRGSNSPEKILSVDRNADGTKEICTVADVEYKKAGSWMCDICIDSNTGHCKNSSGVITGDLTQAACTATSGNTWLTSQECFNQVTTSACTVTMPTGWNLNHTWCQDPGSSWSQSYSGLSCIKSDKSVEFISSTSETATNAWVVGSRILYSAVEDGTYNLKSVTFGTNGAATVKKLISGVEMYEVAIDPTEGVDRVLINGLRFSDNSYVFGSYDFTSDTLNVESGLTGLIDTMLIIGD